MKTIHTQINKKIIKRALKIIERDSDTSVRLMKRFYREYFDYHGMEVEVFDIDGPMSTKEQAGLAINHRMSLVTTMIEMIKAHPPSTFPDRYPLSMTGDESLIPTAVAIACDALSKLESLPLVVIPATLIQSVDKSIHMTEREIQGAIDSEAQSNGNVGSMVAFVPPPACAVWTDASLQSALLSYAFNHKGERHQLVLKHGRSGTRPDSLDTLAFWSPPNESTPEGYWITVDIERVGQGGRYAIEIEDDGSIITESFLALWAYAQTDVVEVHRRRHNGKKVTTNRRGKYAKAKSDIQIVNLRRVDPDATGHTSTGTGSKHEVRYPVRGHHRTLASGRRIWIAGHERGPEDAPKSREKIGVLVR